VLQDELNGQLMWKPRPRFVFVFMAIPFSLLLGRGRCIFVSYETKVIHKIEEKKKKEKNHASA